MRDAAEPVLPGLFRWLIFGVIIGMVPLAADATRLWVHGTPVRLESLIGNGQLLIIVAVICAGGLGEVIGSGRTRSALKLLCGGAATVILMLASVAYTFVQGTTSGNPGDPAFVTLGSVWLGSLGFLATGLCIILART